MTDDNVNIRDQARYRHKRQQSDPHLAEASLQKLKLITGTSGKIRHLPVMYQSIAKDTAERNLPTATLVIPMWTDQDDLPVGSYVAELHLVVKRVDDAENAKKLSPA